MSEKRLVVVHCEWAGHEIKKTRANGKTNTNARTHTTKWKGVMTDSQTGEVIMSTSWFIPKGISQKAQEKARLSALDEISHHAAVKAKARKRFKGWTVTGDREFQEAT